MIHFLQPMWLLALVPVLLIGLAYLWRQLHRRSYAMRFTNVELLRTIAPKGIGLRRHASAAALLACLGALAVGMAKPAVEQSVPLERATIVLAIDVSLSMQSNDVAPTRIEAAQQAAKAFVGQLPESYNLGLVSFAKTATVLVSPTKDRAEVMSAIDGLQLDEATATGEAVFTALDALRTVPADGAEGPPPARILLLSDGYRTYGRTVEEAAAAALEAQVPVSTIAFGTDEGMVDIGGMPQRVPVDRQALAQLAEATAGYYAEAASADELKKVYEDMGSSIGHRTQPRDLTYVAIGLGLLCGLLAGAFSLLWGSRLP